MKSVITISRKWHKPEISTTLWLEGEHNGKFIQLEIPLLDFVKALKAEIGSVKWVFSDKKFEDTFDIAVSNVIEGIKEESVKVV